MKGIVLNDAQRKLVEDNIKLVPAMISRYFPQMYCDSRIHDDLVSIGFEALCYSAFYFNPERGFKFSTLLTINVRNFVRESFFNKKRIIPLDGDAEVDGDGTTFFEFIPDKIERIDQCFTRVLINRATDKYIQFAQKIVDDKPTITMPDKMFYVRHAVRCFYMGYQPKEYYTEFNLNKNKFVVQYGKFRTWMRNELAELRKEYA